MIQNVVRKSLSLSVQKFDWAALLHHLAEEGHVGVIFGMKNELLERFGLKTEQVQASVLYPTKGAFYGDLFFPDAQSTLYLKVTGQRSFEETPVTEDSIWEDPGMASAAGLLRCNLEAGEISPIDIDKGLMLDTLGRYEEAIESFDKAIELLPDDADAWHNRGLVLGTLGRHKEALDSLDMADKLKQSNA